MKNFIMSMLSDSKTGEVSSKRVVGFLGFLFLAITMALNTFFQGNATPSKELVSAVEFVTIAALFGTSAEKFSKFNVNKPTQE
jgi:hypothetical protein